MVQARTAFSMCTGAGTAEMARSLIQKYFNEQGYDMNIKTVAMWAPCKVCNNCFSFIVPTCTAPNKNLPLKLASLPSSLSLSSGVERALSQHHCEQPELV